MGTLRRLRYDLRHNHVLLLMMLPGLALLIIFKYMPMYGILVSFKDYQLFKGFLASKWVGFRQFQRFFNDPFFFRVVRNTFILGFYNLFFNFPAPILLALMLNEVRLRRFKRVVQTVSYLPFFISHVIIVGMLKSFLSPDNGVINNAIAALGMEKINFFSLSSWFRTIYIGSELWQGVGYGSILYLAAITGIDQELYEAARVDGASRTQNIIHITIPCLIPTISILFIMRVGGVITVGFEKVYLMYSSATYETADVISTYVYRMGLMGTDPNISYATAIGLINSVVSMILVWGTNMFSRKFLEESLW